MGNFPPPVHAYIESNIVGTRAPAYLLVDADQRLIDWGGQIECYGLQDLLRGQLVSEQLICLEGILPLEDSDMSLGWIETQPECYADVHMFLSEMGTWILLLDATTEATQYCLMQQKVNDVSLGKEAAVKSLERYCALAENLQRGLCVHQDFTIRFVNSAMAQIFGYEDPEPLIGQDLRELIAPYEHTRLEAYIKAHQQGKTASGSTVWQGVRSDGELCWVELSTSSTTWKGSGSALMSCCDVTEPRQAEAQSQLDQKMTALGALAGGIAYDFNNILTAILGYTQLALYETPQDSHTWSNLHEILTAGKRAQDLVQNILSFSQQRASEHQPMQLHALVVEALEGLRALLPPSAVISEQLEGDAGEVLANPRQIHELLTNLTMNAAHALHDVGRGVLEVRLEPVEIDADMVASNPELRVGPYVRLMVRDTGSGMAPETLARIFEPAFTTKSPGEGLGMGLTLVRSIVASHGGAITVASQPGRGTACSVYFPRIRMHEATDRNTSLSERLPSGQERILLIDDESVLVDLGQEVLTRLGYDVVSHTDVQAALETFRAMPERFDLVITDERMPKMSGESLAHALRAVRPDLPIIMFTECSNMATSVRAQELGIRAFLTKPLVLSDLARAIRHVLD